MLIITSHLINVLDGDGLTAKAYIWSSMQQMTLNIYIQPTENLYFTPITIDNYQIITKIFFEEDYAYVHDVYQKRAVLVSDSLEVRLSGDHQTNSHDWLLYHHTLQQFIGVVSIYYDAVAKKECSVGIAIGQNYRCQGYGLEAIKAIIRFASNDQKMNIIKASTNDSNMASKALFLKANFIDVTQLEDVGPDIKHFYMKL